MTSHPSVRSVAAVSDPMNPAPTIAMFRLPEATCDCSAIASSIVRRVKTPARSACQRGLRAGAPVALGLQPELLEGARVFVLPNPSGRNANYSYAQMLAAFTDLRRHEIAAQILAGARPFPSRLDAGPIA